MEFLRKAWQAFRRLPRWGQAVIVIVVIIIALASAGSSSEEKPADHATATTHERVERTTTTNAPKSDEAELEDDLDDALGSQNRKVKPQVTVKREEDHLAIQWAINENLTEGLTKDGARLQAVDILKAVRKSEIAYSEVWLRGTFELVDKLGNSSEDQVVFAIYDKATIDAIKFDNFLFKNVFDITVEPAFIHPSFRY